MIDLVAINNHYKALLKTVTEDQLNDAILRLKGSKGVKVTPTSFMVTFKDHDNEYRLTLDATKKKAKLKPTADVPLSDDFDDLLVTVVDTQFKHLIAKAG